MPTNQISVDLRADVVVIDPMTRGCLCDGDDGVSSVITAHLERGFLKFLLNLRRVPYLDSTALGCLIHARMIVTSAGGKLRICNVDQRIRDLLRRTKLLPMFELFQSEEEALQGFERTALTAR